MKYSDFFMHVGAIEGAIGYTFRDKSLLAQAFTRTSFCNENHSARAPYQSNEVLEFLGDSVLSLSVASMLTEQNSKRYEFGIKTEFGEGDFSNIKSRLSDKTNLSVSIKKLGIQKYLLMGEGDIKLEIQNEPSVMEDLFESIIGAVYLDSDKNTARVMEVIGNILDVSAYLDSAERVKLGSCKNLLQEWCAEKSRRLPVPEYTVSWEGPDHLRVYTAECRIGDELLGRGVGKNRKSAESAAAAAALSELKLREGGALQRPQAEPLELARAYAKKHGCPSPVYLDVKETERSTKTRPEFTVGCRFAGTEAFGVGASKKEARLSALRKILEELDAF